jgi:hypothetical protein
MMAYAIMKKIFKWLTGFFLLVCLLLAGLIYWQMPHPPSDAQLVQNFQAHRAAFEKLRDMLQADPHLRRVADWGVDLEDPVFLGKPTDAQFSTNRYQQYLSLLKEAGGLMASRDEGPHANPYIFVWAYGFGGDTRHISVCWLDTPPDNQVSSLDDQKIPAGSTNRPDIYRHIDQDWYLWED